MLTRFGPRGCGVSKSRGGAFAPRYRDKEVGGRQFFAKGAPPMNNLTIACVAAGGLSVALAGCVSQQKYNESQQKNAELEQEYQQLNQQMSAEVGAKNMQITRLQNAIRVSINSELLFPSGRWDMSE